MYGPNPSPRRAETDRDPERERDRVDGYEIAGFCFFVAIVAAAAYVLFFEGASGQG